jgi:putative ABC transport system ATP-binding protein
MYQLMRADRSFFWLAFVYTIALALLSLAIPLCVQTLVNSIANIAVFRPVAILAIVLLVLLVAYGVLVALEVYLMEIFERRYFCRITADIVLRMIHADHAYFESINREELVNRYFEIMTIQKNVPRLLVGGLAVVLNAAVGFVVVAFYHPIFLAFNGILVLLLYAVIRVWGPGAVRTAGELSDQKYRFARWLEEMARANTVFKASRYIDYALERTEAVTAEYIARHRRHFRYRFAQVIALLAIYALASSSMLALGGWLIIAGELTLGQLVAAELILSVIFASLVGFGWYLDAFYETCAGLEKIAYFYRVPAEDGRGQLAPPPGPARLVFARATSGSRRGACVLDFEVPAGRTVMAVAESSSLQKTVLDLAQRYRTPTAGSIRFSGLDLADCDPHALRDGIAVVDSSGVLERTVFEYLAVGCPDLTQSQARDLLRTLGLESTLDGLEQGFDTPLQPFGYPLSRSEVLRLKLAAALLSRPALLFLTETFDIVNRTDRARIIGYLSARQETTVIYFSNRRDTDGFSDYLYIGSQGQMFFPTLGALVAHEERLAATGRESA